MKVKISMLIFVMISLFFITSNYRKSEKGISSNTTLSELTYLANAHAESTTCSVDCGDGTSVSLTCSYECRTSSGQKKVVCVDENNNIVEEKTC